MKNYLFLFVFACTAAMIFIAAKGTEKPMSYSAPAVSNTYRYEIPAGSITNTEQDTVDIPTQFLDTWIPSVFVESVRTSGTMALNVVLQESSTLTGSGTWIPRDSAAITNAATGRTNFNYSAAPYHFRGLRARIIIKGSGTQVATYRGRLIAKRTN